MSELVKIVKPIHTVVEFTDMIDRYHGADESMANEGTYSWQNEIEEILFFYSLLGKDAVVWDQKVKIRKSQKITMLSPEEPQRTYMFTYFFQASMPLHVASGSVFESRTLVFSNDQGSYTFQMPKGFEGHILQLILSESFLYDFVPEKYLDHPLVQNIIHQSSSELLVLKDIPMYLHAELRKISDRMSKGAAGKEGKLPLLQLLAHFMDVFFKDFVGQERKMSKSTLDKGFKQQVTALMNTHKLESFRGISFFADQLSLTESTFKRLFYKHFKSTPLDYFKLKQHKYAQAKLQSGKYSVTDIAYKLGYSSNANFVRSYKKYMGVTPGKELTTPSDSLDH